MRKHTYRSELNVSQLPRHVTGVGQEVEIVDGAGRFAPSSFPAVHIVKFGRYAHDCCGPIEIDATIAHAQHAHPLAGFVGEGKSPYGSMDTAQEVLRNSESESAKAVSTRRSNASGTILRRAVSS